MKCWEIIADNLSKERSGLPTHIATTQRKKTQTKTMLQAHEALCEAAPENMLRYKDVLDFLRQKLHYETPSK